MCYPFLEADVGKDQCMKWPSSFQLFLFSNLLFYNRKSTGTRSNAALDNTFSFINTAIYTCAAKRTDQKQSIWRIFCRCIVYLSERKVRVITDMKGRTRYIWLKTGPSGGLLWARQWTLELHKNAWNFFISRASIRFSRKTFMHGIGYIVHLMQLR